MDSELKLGIVLLTWDSGLVPKQATLYIDLLRSASEPKPNMGN